MENISQNRPSYEDLARRVLDLELSLEKERLRMPNLGGVSMDFSNILCALHGFTNLALGEVDKSSVLGEYIREISRYNILLADLASSVFNPLRGNDYGCTSAFDLEGILKEMVDNSQKIDGAEGVNFSYKACFDASFDLSMTVRCSKTNLMQLYSNILINAVDSIAVKSEDIEGNNRINVLVRNISGKPELKSVLRPDSKLSEGQYIVVEIADSGKGISEKDCLSVFEPFLTTKVNGTGIGLAICKCIANQAGGDIFVESELGVGSKFSVYLPVFERNVKY